MFPNAEDIDARLIGALDLREKIADPVTLRTPDVV